MENVSDSVNFCVLELKDDWRIMYPLLIFRTEIVLSFVRVAVTDFGFEDLPIDPVSLAIILTPIIP